MRGLRQDTTRKSAGYRTDDGASPAATVHDRLRTLILEGTIAPGSVLSQVKLAEDLGVSRTPLREALRRLQEEGLITAERNRRARVADFDPDDLESLYATRIAVEALAIYLTVPRLTDADLAELRAAFDEMHAAVRDYEAWELPHRRFHELLTLHCGEKLRESVRGYAQRAERYRRIWLYADSGTNAWAVGDAEHEAILRACEERAADLAAKRLAGHVGRAGLTMMTLMVPAREPRVIRGALQLTLGAETVPMTPGGG